MREFAEKRRILRERNCKLRLWNTETSWTRSVNPHSLVHNTRGYKHQNQALMISWRAITQSLETILEHLWQLNAVMTKIPPKCVAGIQVSTKFQQPHITINTSLQTRGEIHAHWNCRPKLIRALDIVATTHKLENAQVLHTVAGSQKLIGFRPTIAANSKCTQSHRIKSTLRIPANCVRQFALNCETLKNTDLMSSL